MAAGLISARGGDIAVEPKVKLWIEKAGLLALSDYRVQLLQHVADTGSLAQAAERMGLSYRRAWGKIKEIERNLGVRLVQSEVGGVGGGRTRLTPQGELLLVQYRRFRTAVEADVGREFVKAFGERP
jgi:molybdate transport system regulatory protein